jgi:uncharacterized protein (DUF433 family)
LLPSIVGAERCCVDLAPARYHEREVEAQRMKFIRITTNPAQMGGVPCIRGLRIPAATVVAMVADGMTDAEIVDALPDLGTEDVHEALRYAAEALRERELPLTAP